MGALIFLLLNLGASLFKSKSRLEAENAALRQQLIVLQRKVRGRVQFTNGDRLFFIRRFFPSQDTMAAGGFGNLIALPLQNGPRQLGNSVFVDDELRPYDDQWAFLSNLSFPKIPSGLGFALQNHHMIGAYARSPALVRNGLSSTCSSRGAGLKPRTCSFAINSASP